MELKELIRQKFDEANNKIEFINSIKDILYELSPTNANPVDRVIWVSKDKVLANNYNPNHVAEKEMSLLYTSIKEDGYTQPIVTVYNKELQKYIIVDGFHRNLIIRMYQDINDRCLGYLPIVVIDKDIDQRMESTVRHNRARGSHSVDGMTNIIFTMMKDGKSEKEICDKLGLEAREFEKLKYITGFAKLFKNYDYSRSIDTIVQVPHSIETDKLPNNEADGN